ncbi:MAG: hypothetical protein H6733_13105 [Alphaproteobacteria bacterium]|nr:hypothetical protein [Alphaproteobacteria bacterium]
MKHMSHDGGADAPTEILFDTPFHYMFPYAAASEPCRVKATPDTVAHLKALADAMGDPGTQNQPMPNLFDSSIPAIFTYFGQFIDHDTTARTDRDGDLSKIGDGHTVEPLDTDKVVAGLKNGRRPQLDLDSLYGDGPAMAPGAVSEAQAFGLYDPQLHLNLHHYGNGKIDLPRRADGTAIIADERNDENAIVAQLHAAMIAFHNAVASKQSGSTKARYIRARQLVRWAYQYLVVHAYLPAVCDENVVADILANGPRFMGPSTGRTAFMPLEFSVAGFRFGHSMIRPFYDLNDTTERTIDQLLFATKQPGGMIGGHLNPTLLLDWERFRPGGSKLQHARKIDPRIAQGLFQLTFGGNDSVLKHLARRNLLRAFSLSIPTGQAIADCMGVEPLKPGQLKPAGNTPQQQAIADALSQGDLDTRTPLWFYILREAAVQQDGRRLGEVGSRLVAETLYGMIVQDPSSYIHHRHDAAIKSNGVRVWTGAKGLIGDLDDLLKAAGVA